MASATETLITRLQADCTAAEAAEHAVRANVDAQIERAGRDRAFAWRRLSALSDMARIAAAEPERETAVGQQLVSLFREIGWIEDSLVQLGEGAGPLVDRLRPVAEALHAQAHPTHREDGEAREPSAAADPVADPIAAFRAFESWYEAERGKPFLQEFERYVAPTPVVEF